MSNLSLQEQTKILDEHIWHTYHKNDKIEGWLDNFQGEDKDMAHKLLNHFVYFNSQMTKEMLISLYRDFIEYPIRQKVLNEVDVEKLFKEELNQTRFLGMGNPAESGTHLLYYFRQVNNINKDLFIDQSKVDLSDTQIKRYIYIDDMSITGKQVCEYANTKAKEISEKRIEVNCYLLCATKKAIDKIKNMNIFNSVESVFELDESFKCFGDSSRYFLDDASNRECKEMVEKYGKRLYEDHVLGYKNSQLLFGLEHNTPNNTLPIFWSEKDWNPIFKRYGKNYG
jgi:hypothetical protein